MNRLTSRRHHLIHRRSLLRGALGVTIALPWLEVYLRTAQAQQMDPLRLQIFIHGNGVHPPEWYPDELGGALPNYALAPHELKNSLQPLTAYKNRMIIFGGVDGVSAIRSLEGRGKSGHTIAGAHLLTGSETTPNGRFDGMGYAESISFDQELAAFIGRTTPVKSLNVGFKCDEAASGQMPRARYSYTGRDAPITPEHRPQEVFTKLVGFTTPANDPAAKANAELIRAERVSVLDLVGDELESTRTALGVQDQARLDEYLTHLRALETAVSNQVPIMCDVPPAPAAVNVTADSSLPLVSSQMLQLTQIAMQCDITRVGVFQIQGEQSGISYGDIDDPIVAGVGGSHHNLSHHPDEKIGKICKLHSQILAEHVARLDAIPEGTGTMLDNTIILYTGGIENGNQHNFDNLPHVLLGGTKVLNTGQAMMYPRGAGVKPRTNNDLFTTLFHAFGVIEKTSFGRPEYMNYGVLSELLK
ncbi:MAG: hypothetical protein RJA70_1476 [Pseudomonadota bacterium]|jgi:hypothetical protein